MDIGSIKRLAATVILLAAIMHFGSFDFKMTSETSSKRPFNAKYVQGNTGRLPVHFSLKNIFKNTPEKAERPCIEPSEEMAKLEKEVLDLINHSRLDPENKEETRGARILVWDDEIACVARAHTKDMIERDYMTHKNPEGLGVIERIDAAGIKYSYVGENIGHGRSVVVVHEAFMREPKFERNHRFNILSSRYSRAGVGVMRLSEKQILMTTDFVGIKE